MHFGIGGVGVLRIGKRAEVAVEVDVVLIDPAQVRESVGVYRMNEQHRDPSRIDPPQQVLVLKDLPLAARAAETLNAVRAGSHHQQRRRIGHAEQHAVGGEGLALRALEGIHGRFDGQATAAHCSKEAGAGVCVVRSKMGVCFVHPA